jgi:hypothetical protein
MPRQACGDAVLWIGRFCADPDPNPTFPFNIYSDPDPDPTPSFTQMGKSALIFNFAYSSLHCFIFS